MAPVFYFYSLSETDFFLRIASTFIYFALLYLSAIWLFRILVKFFPSGKGLFLVATWILILVLATVFAEQALINLISGESFKFHFINNNTKPRLVFSLMFLGTTAVYAYLKKKDNIEKQLHLQLLQLNQLQHETELQMVQKQLQPHFLFNSLNSINALITINPEKASEMIIQLSEFFRNSLKQNTGDIISMEEELRHIRLYLNIEKIRFEERLHIVFNIEEATKKLAIPSLLLQPLLENAIKYGLYGTLETVEIAIIAKQEQGDLLVSISNTYAKDNEQQSPGTGFGISSTKKRLQLLYKQSNLVSITKSDNLFEIALRIPQHPSRV